MLFQKTKPKKKNELPVEQQQKKISPDDLQQEAAKPAPGVNQQNSKKETFWKLPENEQKFSDENVFEHIRRSLRDREHEYEVAIGTDSQIKGRLFRFITVLCIWKKGKGGTYYYKTEYIPRSAFPVSNQKMRMFDEVSKTIDLALQVEDKTGYKPIIHVDASIPSKKEFTSSFSEQLKGYVVSCGYECVLKPESYVANCIADRHTKRKLRARDVKEFTKSYGPKET